MRRVVFLLNRGGTSESTATALALAERLLDFGHRVSVFAHDEAVTLSAGGAPSAQIIASLLRKGMHSAPFDWVVEGAAADALGVSGEQVAGVVPGDHADLWALIRQADVVLTPDGGV